MSQIEVKNTEKSSPKLSDQNEFPIQIENPINSDSDLEEEPFSLGEEHALIKLSSHSLNEFRQIRNAIEEVLIKKVRKMENLEKPLENEKYVYYFKNYFIDNIGKLITQGETGIAEGWNVPIYENEFQNLLGLPFHEDNALAETLRIKKPRLECFNCLATNHRVQDCPVKIDEERINLHRRIFTNQSIQAQEQAELFSCRYTSDLDSKANRGFVPGKISEQLRQALGIKSNQLPPYIYLMRELGYPTGWLIEAKVTQKNLTLVHDGEQKKIFDNQNETSEQVEYDQDRIYSFPGFNEMPPPEFLDESDKYGVERYGEKFSRESFLKTLNLRKKKIIRRSLSKKNLQSEESESEEEEEKIEIENNKTVESIEEGAIEDSIEEESEKEAESPKKRKKKAQSLDAHGKSFTEILGTPIIENVSNVKSVPNWESFSKDICDHKPFEMEANTPTGSYQNIVKLTREFKSKSNNSFSSSQ